MKLFCKIFFLIIVFNVSHSQNNKIPILKNCGDNENVLSCSYFTIHNLILNELNKLEIYTVGDNIAEITVSSLLKVKKNGALDIANSIFYSKEIEVNIPLDDILSKIPIIQPRANKKGENISSYFRNTFYFSLNDGTFTSWSNPQPNKDDFYIPNKFPVYSGCKTKWNNDRLKKCLSQGLAKYLKSEFNSNNQIKKSGILSGTSVRILVFFKIDTQGKVINVGARANNKVLEDEAIRVIESLNDMTPGYFAHKPVIVPLSIPINLTISY